MAQARSASHTRALTYTYAECHASTIELPRPFAWDLLLPLSPGTWAKASPNIPEIDEGRHAAGGEETTTAAC